MPNRPQFAVAERRPQIVIYQQQVQLDRLRLGVLKFLESVPAHALVGGKYPTQPFFQNLCGVPYNSLVSVRLWILEKDIPLNVGPVTEKPGMYRAVPSFDLNETDVHALYFAGAVLNQPTVPVRSETVFPFVVGRGTNATLESRSPQSPSSREAIPSPDQDVGRLASLIQDGRRQFQANNWRAAEGAYLKVLNQDPENFEATAQLSSIYIRLGDFDKSKIYGQTAMNLRPDHPNPYYNMACTYARMGDSERAMALLREAVAKGFKDFEWMRRDPDLESIRNDPRFKRLSDR